MTKLRHDLSSWLLKSPHDGVIWLAWIYVVGVCLYSGGGPFAGDLVWFDDRVRLVQIFNWLNGAGWYDRTIMRANLPEGFHTIWSRVVDLPAAGIIAAFQSFVGQMRAGMIAAIIIPLIETLLLFFAASYFAEPLVGKSKAKLVTLFVLFGSCINPEAFTLAGFQVGMLSHHSWYVLLTLTLLGSLGRLLIESNTGYVVAAGASIGGLLMVGIEGLPLIAGSYAFIAIIGWLQNRQRLIFDAFRSVWFGSVLGFLLLPLNQPAGNLLHPSFAEPSITGPTLVLGGAFFLAAQFYILKFSGSKKYVALSFIALAGALTAAFLIKLFPQLLDGAAAALSPEERKLAADEHQEAMTIYHLARNTMDYVRMIVPPLLALAFGLHQLRNPQTTTERSLTLFYLGLLILTFGMASIFSRYFHYLSLATSPWLLLICITAAGSMARDEYYAIKNFVLYFLIGPLWLWLVPAANFNMAFGTSVLMYPAKLQTEPQHCDTHTITNYLDLRYGNDKTIIVPMYKSDHFLLHTKMNIFFLANFPSQNKFMDAKAFYETGDIDEAKRIVTDHHIDLAAVCTQAYLVSTKSTLTNQLLKGHMSFGQMLVTGQVPDWLKPVDTPVSTRWLIFEVDKDKLGNH